MKPIVTQLLRRSLMTLGAIVVWAKALGRGSDASGGQSSARQSATAENADVPKYAADARADPVNAGDRSKDGGGSKAKAQS
jgi:hypothetical protein